MKNSRYIVGLICIALAFIASVISFYFVLFALPVFIIGALLVMFSKARILRKVLTIVLPALLWIPCSFAFIYLYNYTPPKIVLIPEGYEGPLRIVYGEPCGQKASKQDGKTVWKFPVNGVLILQEEFDGGMVNEEYYILHRNGAREKIKPLLHNYDLRPGETSICFGSSGTIGHPVKDIEHTNYHLWIKDTRPYSDDKTSQAFDSLTRALVDECRGKR